MPDPFDEIIVRGQREDPFFELQRGFTGSRQNIPANIVGAGLPATPLFPAPDLPVAVVPTRPPPPPGGATILPFPEIKVTAKRPAPFPRPAPSGWLPLGSNAALFIAQIGTLWTDFRSRSMLEDVAAGALAPYESPPDTPVETEQSGILPEIIVTASRADALGANLGLEIPPLPQFDPWRDVEISPSPGGVPLEIPTPDLVPTEIPAPLPAPAPSPAARPSQVPLIRPAEIPMTQPGFQVRTSPNLNIRPSTSRVPRPGSGLTAGQSGVVGSILNFAQPAPLPQPDQAKCKPCPKKKKEKEKPRKQCFKKFVEERLYPRWDREVEWQEIDCETGLSL